MYRSKAAYLFLTVCVAVLTLLSCPTADSPPGGNGNGLVPGMDLEPKLITFAVSYIEDGELLSIILPIENKAADTVTTDFDVHFYLSTDTTFEAAAPDSDLGTVNVTTDIAGGTTLNINPSFTMPEVGVNQSVYIYAVVDSTYVVAENDETNNQSTTDTAAVILLYDDEPGPPRSYNIVFETFPPTGSGSTDTVIFLYKDVTGTGTYQGVDDDTGDYAQYSKITGLYDTGTYYLLVRAYSAGPYALSVRTANIDIKLFGTDLSSDPDESDNDPPHVSPYTDDLLNLPPASTDIKVGATSNRYAGNPDWDWFKIVLP